MYNWLKKTLNTHKFSGIFSGYAIIILLSILINIIGYGVAVKIVAEDISKANQKLLENVGQTCDYYLQDLSNNAYRIANSYNAMQIQKNLDNAQPMQRVEYINSIKESMIAVCDNNPLAENVIIMFSGMDMVISQDGAQNVDTEYNYKYSSIFKSRRDWQEMVFSVNGTDYLYVTSDTGESYLYFVFVKNEYFKARIAVMTEIDINNFDYIFDKHSGSKQVMVVHRESGAVVNSDEKIPDEHSYIVLRYDSNVRDFEYILPMLKSDYNHRLKIVMMGFVVSYILCLMIAGSFALMYARKNYNTMQRMEENIRNKNDLIRNDILCRILQGRSGRELSVRAHEIGIDLNSRYYELVIFEIFDDAADTDLINAQIRSGLEEAQGSAMHIEYAYMNDSLVCVMCRPDELMTRAENDRVLSEICSRIKSMYNISVYCAVSAIAENIDELAREYSQTSEIFNFINEDNERRVYHRDDVSDEFRSYEFTHDMETKLISLIERKHFDEAYSYICQMVEYNINHLHIAPVMIRVLISVIVNTLIKSVQTIALSAEPDYQKLCRAVAEHTDEEGIKRILKIIGEFINELNVLAENEMNDAKCDKRLEDVLAYIEENFAKSELNVAGVAYHFDLTPNYMSRWFSEKVGRTLLDYILSMRINKAKELLADTEMLVDEIGRAVGFSSAMVFIKAFKRYENMTPAKYRQENKY